MGPSAASAVVRAGERWSTSYEHALEKVDDVASHPTHVRVAFLAVIILLLCIPLRNLVTTRGAVTAETGYRFMCVGSCFAAVGNAYAPLVVGSTAGLDREVMARFVMGNETSWVSFGTVGAILLTTGLVRARVLPAWQVIVLGVAFVVIMPIPTGVATLALAAVFAVMFTLVMPASVREDDAGRREVGRAVAASTA